MRIALLSAAFALAGACFVGGCAQEKAVIYQATEVSSTQAVVRAHVVEVSTSLLDELANEKGFSSLRHSYFTNAKGQQRIVPSLDSILMKGPSWHLETSQNTVDVGHGLYDIGAASAENTRTLNMEVLVKRWNDVTDNAGDSYAIYYNASVGIEGSKDPLTAEGTALMRAGTPYVKVLRSNAGKTTLLFIEAGRNIFTPIDAPAVVEAPVVIEPVIEEPVVIEPVVETPEPVVEKPEPVVEKPEPIVEEPEPVVEEPAPVEEKRKTIELKKVYKLKAK